MYGRSAVAYGPYGGYGRAASYNPETGAYARGAVAWDSNEIAGRGVAYNPRTGTGVATHRYANESGSWGESLVTHNDKWLRTKSARGDQGTVITDVTGNRLDGEFPQDGTADDLPSGDGVIRTTPWFPDRVPGGVYFLRLDTRAGRSTSKVTLLPR